MLNSASAPRRPKVVRAAMELSDLERRSISIWEQMRAIEGELFLLSARSGAFDFENNHRFEHLCGQRTQLAGELLLSERR